MICADHRGKPYTPHLENVTFREIHTKISNDPTLHQDLARRATIETIVQICLALVPLPLTHQNWASSSRNLTLHMKAHRASTRPKFGKSHTKSHGLEHGIASPLLLPYPTPNTPSTSLSPSVPELSRQATSTSSTPLPLSGRALSLIIQVPPLVSRKMVSFYRLSTP